MITFTKEQLIARINQVTAINKYRISRDPAADGLAMDNELFAIALASLEAEASYFINRVKHSDAYGEDVELRTYCYELDALKSKDDFGGEIVPVFTAPPAPVSVPDAIEPTVEAVKRILPTSNPDDYAACIGADMWNACRAAMLQGAEPVTNKDDGGRSEQDDSPECGWVVTHSGKDYFYREQKDAVTHMNSAVESGIGVSLRSFIPEPITTGYRWPDGWVACSERMPHINVPVITCCGDVVQYAAYAWDGKEWQDWYEEYDKLPASTFTHWHPRPAAPQQEVNNDQ